MKKIILLIGVLSIVSQSINAQIIFNDDTTVCGIQPFTLNAISSDVDSLVTDDAYTDVVDIGFNFDFYGNTYNKMLISSNGYVTFDTSNATGYSPYSINAPIPNPGFEPENAILVTWQDTDPNFGGAIYFGSYGASPNKVYVVTWCAIPMFSCNQLIYTSQLRMYEGSNKIEMYLQDRPLCLTWNGGAGIQGTVDATSTNFDIVNDPIILGNPPRNFPTLWTATNEGWEFIPNGITSFNINQIPFTPVAAGNTTWTDALGNIIGLGSSINVMPSITTTYYANMNSLCSGSLVDSVTITVGSSITSNVSTINASCKGDDAQITVLPNQGITQPPWIINLLNLNGSVVQTQNNVMNSHSFTNLFPGSYMAQVVEPNSGCSGVTNVSVGQDSIFLNLSISQQNVSCYDGCDASISIQASGGMLPYNYYIDGVLNPLPFPGDSLFSDLCGGSYIISVMDNNDCMIRDTIIVTSPNSPLQAITSSKTVLCHSDSTSISVAHAIGGTGPYNYLWYSSVGGLPSTIISYTDTAFGLSSGIYFAEVTDANGCDTVSSVQVLSANTALFSTTQVGQVICKGDYSGYLIADAGGGFAPYTYIWSTSLSGVIQNSSSAYNTDTLDNLSSGVYLLDIVDHFGCTVSQASYTVNEPIQPLVLDTVYLIDSIACFGDNDGRALGVKSGGDPSYTYLWDNGESTLLANHLTSGYHTLSVMDDRGCEVLDSIYIPESSEILSSLVIEESISCYGSTNGVVSVSTVGGYPLYLYSWSNSQPVYTGIVDTAFSLSYGVYSLITEDSLGCLVVDSVYLSEPGLLAMEAKELSWISCNGISDGLAFSAAYGGTLPYTFVWDNNQIGDTVNTLSEGLHTVIVTDARGCIASDTVLIHEPPLLTVGISVLDSVYCNGVNTGSLATYALGGTPFVGTSSLYTYLWDDALQASQTTAIATNLSADAYTVVVTDSRGCTATATADITNVTNTMSVSATSTNVSCYGSADGSTSVVASGGHAPYSYDWVGNNGLSLSTLSSIQNLLAGTYSVTVSDTNNCIRNTSVDIIEPLGILFDIAGSLDESCVGGCDGLIYIDSLSGGTLPYTALLTNNVSGLVTQHAVQSNTILNVCSGSYTISLTDANECSSSVLFSGNSQAVVSSVVTLATPSISLLNDILCYGAGTGELMVTSADPNYTYLWEDLSNVNFNSSSVTVSNLFAGDYIVTVQYTNSSGQLLTGCNVSSDTLILLDGDEIIITETLHTDVLCHGDNTGAISIFSSGGLLPHTYAWTPSQNTTTTIVNLLAGNYTLTVEDANNCEQSSVFTIVEPQALTSAITQNGYILTASNPSGGVAPYSYSWRNQSNPTVHLQGGVTYNVYSVGTYYLQITDGNGCEMNSNSFEYLTTGIIQVSSDLVLSIYPNPFKDETTVDFGRVIKQASVRVVDVFGKIIEEHSITNTDKHILKRENKASGIYFIEIESDEVKLFYKIIIE